MTCVVVSVGRGGRVYRSEIVGVPAIAGRGANMQKSATGGVIFLASLGEVWVFEY